jgi:tetratricopeptide (TPR) repeat protein
VALLSTVIARRPDYAHAWRFRAKAQERLGRREDAIRDLSVASGLNPDDLVTRFNLGALLTQAGRYDEGARFLQQVMDLGAVANQGLSANLLARGRATEGDAALDLFRQAEREARKGLALDATLPWLHVNLGASLMEQHRVRGGADQGSVAEAGREYEQALALSKRRRDPEGMKVYGSALVNLCDLLIQTSRLDRALQVCREVTEQFPTRADAAYNLAAVHALMGRSEEALAGLRRDFDLGDREWSYLAGDPWFSSLHADPRFRAIVARMRDDAASP